MQSLYNAMFHGHYIWVLIIRHKKIVDPYLFPLFFFFFFFLGGGGVRIISLCGIMSLLKCLIEYFLIKISRKHIIARSFKLSMISSIMSRLPVIFKNKLSYCPLQIWTLKTCNYVISNFI